ncbi:MAG: DNA-3-methyladenine glycosylase I [Deltaproteobacteria bacterium]|jgi:DNA-3-methyladenine glycosylase I|nr:DNA-3-methyladenine glycosylase I [Deltaproteobacteria bacterium]
MNDNLTRCPWAMKDPLSQHYHDAQWGKPCRDEPMLFKMLLLEGQQAGLAWVTILRKWDTLCAAFDNFDPAKVALYDDLKVAQLLSNPGIIRNRLKVAAAIENAKAYYRLCQKYGSLDRYIWSFTEEKPIVGRWETMAQIPVKTALSDKISLELKKFGFKFVGSTIVYSWLEAIGVVNDHILACSFR